MGNVDPEQSVIQDSVPMSEVHCPALDVEDGLLGGSMSPKAALLKVPSTVSDVSVGPLGETTANNITVPGSAISQGGPLGTHITVLPPLPSDEASLPVEPDPSSSVPLVKPDNPVEVLSPMAKMHCLALSVPDDPVDVFSPMSNTDCWALSVPEYLPSGSVSTEVTPPATPIHVNRNVLDLSSVSADEATLFPVTIDGHIEQNLAEFFVISLPAYNVIASQSAHSPNGLDGNPPNRLPLGHPNGSPTDSPDEVQQADPSSGEIHDVDTLLVILVGLLTLLGTTIGIIAIPVPLEVHDILQDGASHSMPRAWLRLWGLISLSLSDVLVLIILALAAIWAVWVYINRHHLVIKRVILGFLAFFLVLIFCVVLKLAPVTKREIFSGSNFQPYDI